MHHFLFIRRAAPYSSLALQEESDVLRRISTLVTRSRASTAILFVAAVVNSQELQQPHLGGIV